MLFSRTNYADLAVSSKFSREVDDVAWFYHGACSGKPTHHTTTVGVCARRCVENPASNSLPAATVIFNGSVRQLS